MSGSRYNYLFLFFALLLFAFAGCSPEDVAVQEDSIVVEGWIETGMPPVVIVSSSFSLDEVSEMDDVSEVVGTWAKVTVSDGFTECVLFGKKDSRYFPPYVYSTTEMEGVAGRTYKLTVEYNGKTVYAQSTLPPAPPAPDSVYLEKSEVCDTLYSIAVKFYDDGNFNHRIRTMVYGRDKIPRSSLLGLVKKSDSARFVRSVVDRGYSSEGNEERYFGPGDNVVLSLSSIDDYTYDFWLKYENLRSTRMLMSLFETKMPSNIVGGKGCWAAYGTTVTRIQIGNNKDEVEVL